MNGALSRILRLIGSRLAYAGLTLLVVTGALYGMLTLAPAEMRAALYLPPNTRLDLDPEVERRVLDTIIRDHHLDQPFPVQYLHWVSTIVKGDWGWSPVLRSPVLAVLLQRAPMTAELTLHAMLLVLTVGIFSGAWAGARQNSPGDRALRLAAYVATSVPGFILGLVLLAIFYVGLRWLPTGRTSIPDVIRVSSSDFTWHTGLLTVDGLLNGRPDISLDALRHLALPVLSLSLAHCATVSRITRAAMAEEIGQEYVVAARARGLPPGRVVWRHALRNAVAPSLTSLSLSAASLVTGVYIIEAIFDLPGLSSLVIRSLAIDFPDVSMALGFAVFSVVLVLPIMLGLDVFLAVADPRLRETDGSSA